MFPLTLPILRLLSDGEFHSGAALAAHFGISRASIWNALQGTDALGVELYKVRGRGYQMPNPIDWYDLEHIKLHLGRHSALLDVQILETVESTNSLLLQAVGTKQIHGRCAIAEIQTQGRGRRGRSWQSALGGSLSFSLGWQFNVGVSQLSGLSLAVGVAIARALNELEVSNIQLKWPNDILHNFHKLGGVLIELQGDALGPSTTVIGIGLNYRLNVVVKNRIDQAVSDLTSLKADIASRNQVLGVALRHLANVLEVFAQQGFSVLRQEWLQLHAYQDKPVMLRMPDGLETQGIVRDVTVEGVLVLETALGVRQFGSGEMSMRPYNNAQAQKA